MSSKIAPVEPSPPSRVVPRWRRILAMGPREILRRSGRKFGHWLSPRKNLRRLAYRLDRFSLGFFPAAYRERPEYGPSNLQMKLDRLAAGGPFEPYDVTLVNRGAAQLLGEARSVLEVGAGTGMFATMAAEGGTRRVVASEFDHVTRAWTMENRPASNIEYCDRALDTFGQDEFDVVVALEVIEHIDAYGPFLRDLTRVAPRAILTTPNKFRTALDSVADTPAFDQHVREWSAGEFLWVLRAFYAEVELYTVPNMPRQIAALQRDSTYQPTMQPCGVHSRQWCLIANCRRPLRDGN